MGVKRTTLPQIPEPNEFNLVEAIRSIKEILEVGIHDIDRGDSLDAWVTYREWMNGNTITDVISGVVGTGGLTLGGGNRPGPDDGFPPGADPTKYHLPGRPENVETVAVWDGIMVKWEWPDQTDAYLSWARANIYASTTTQFTDAQHVGYSTGNFFVHTNLGLSDPNATIGIRYYWVRLEDWDRTDDELVFTQFTPYEFEDGIKGQTALNTEFTVESFTISCGAGAAVNPFVCGEVVTGYDENGDPIIETGVGLSGQFIVHGTITADQLQAGIIGADLINAQEIWAEISNATLLIAQTMTTRLGLDFRLEINGWGGEKAGFPLWYGHGPTGGDEGLFWFQNGINEAGDWMWSSFYLSGEMIVTGAGKFYGGSVTRDAEGNILPTPEAFRIEIGGPDTPFLLWAGSGFTGVGDESNPIFYIDNGGNAVFRGTVEAKYVSGEISRTTVINDWEASTRRIQLPNHSLNTIQQIDNDPNLWVTVDDWELGAPPFDSGHVPTIHLSFDAYGSGFDVCYVRVQMWNMSNQDPDYEARWFTLNTDVVETGVYGGNYFITGVSWRIYAKSKFRLQFARFPNKDSWVEHGHRTGYLLGIR